LKPIKGGTHAWRGTSCLGGAQRSRVLTTYSALLSSIPTPQRRRLSYRYYTLITFKTFNFDSFYILL
jgi:hypothetical protein